MITFILLLLILLFGCGYIIGKSTEKAEKKERDWMAKLKL